MILLYKEVKLTEIAGRMAAAVDRAEQMGSCLKHRELQFCKMKVLFKIGCIRM
jgi:hypothetical protein